MSRPNTTKPVTLPTGPGRFVHSSQRTTKKVQELSEQLGTATAAASYILELVRPLSGLAQHNSMDMLAHLLEMAALEAAELAMVSGHETQPDPDDA